MSQVRSDTPFIKKLKEILKIKPRVKNKNYNAKIGTKTPDRRFASFRENTEENKKLQKEAKDPRKNIRTYKRVTSENKKNFSDQHKVTNTNTKTNSKNKKPKAGSARERLRAKNVKRFGKAHVDRLVAKNKEFQAAKKDKEKMKAYRKKYGK
tara:strand:- start:55 stop:510 length:456 start_codon:yes stop_codon:yes gene_type:complete